MHRRLVKLRLYMNWWSWLTRLAEALMRRNMTRAVWLDIWTGSRCSYCQTKCPRAHAPQILLSFVFQQVKRKAKQLLLWSATVVSRLLNSLETNRFKLISTIFHTCLRENVPILGAWDCFLPSPLVSCGITGQLVILPVRSLVYSYQYVSEGEDQSCYHQDTM